MVPEVLSARPRASARPSNPAADVPPPVAERAQAPASDGSAVVEPAARRTARIVVATRPEDDLKLRERARLLDRLLASDGRGSISRAADDFRKAGFDFPSEQAVHLQLLEHLDESLARDAIEALREILAREAPLKRPVFDQRLRRLEDMAEEELTRSAASELRRALRG